MTLKQKIRKWVRLLVLWVNEKRRLLKLSIISGYKSLFKLYKLRFHYSIDEKARVVRVRINKPSNAMTLEEEAEIDNLMSHFSARDYFVKVL